MILKYGTYAHAANEASVEYSYNIEYDELGRARLRVDTFNISGELQLSSPSGVQATDQASLTTAINALKTAYATNGRDICLYLADGTTATSYRIVSANTLTGTRVRSVRFPAEPGVYAISAKYEIVVDAESRVSTSGGGSSDITSWQESVTIIGRGGPIWALLPTLTGTWQKQVIYQTSPIRVIQSGSAMGANARPREAAPLFGVDLEHSEERQIVPSGPEFVNGRHQNFGIAWTYVFESATPIYAAPRPL